jgi:hypothetical protein
MEGAYARVRRDANRSFGDDRCCWADGLRTLGERRESAGPIGEVSGHSATTISLPGVGSAIAGKGADDDVESSVGHL